MRLCVCSCLRSSVCLRVYLSLKPSHVATINCAVTLSSDIVNKEAIALNRFQCSNQ